MKTITLQVPDEQVEEVAKFAEVRHFGFFVEDESDVEIPEWQKEEVLRRIDYSKKHPESVISLEEFKKKATEWISKYAVSG